MAVDRDERSAARQHEIQFRSAAHPCRPLMHFGAGSVALDWQRSATWREQHDARLRIIILGVGARCWAWWRLRNGRRERILLAGESVWIVPSGVRHGAEWHGRVRVMSLFLDTEWARAVADRDVRDVSVAPLRRYTRLVSLIGDLCASTWQECDHDRSLNQAIVGGLAMSLGSQILRAHFAPTRPGDQQWWQLLRTSLADVLSYVEANFEGDLSLEALATVAKLSPSYFGQMFRMATGLPPLAYVVGARVRRAKELLRSGTHRATEVAHMVGFSSQARMNQAFRITLNMSPTDYIPSIERNRVQIENTRKRVRWRFC